MYTCQNEKCFQVGFKNLHKNGGFNLKSKKTKRRKIKYWQSHSLGAEKARWMEKQVKIDEQRTFRVLEGG